MTHSLHDSKGTGLDDGFAALVKIFGTSKAAEKTNPDYVTEHPVLERGREQQAWYLHAYC